MDLTPGWDYDALYSDTFTDLMLPVGNGMMDWDQCELNDSLEVTSLLRDKLIESGENNTTGEASSLAGLCSAPAAFIENDHSYTNLKGLQYLI